MSEPVRRPFRRWIGRFCLLNLIVTAGVTVWFRMNADEHWLATLLLFGPRVLAFVPLVVLAPLALLGWSRLGLLWCAIAAVIVAWPFMGLALNADPELAMAKPQGVLRVATFNADNKEYDQRGLLKFFQDYQPDLVAFQDADRVRLENLPPGWNLYAASNGLKLAAKESISLAAELDEARLGPARGAAKFRVKRDGGEVEILVLHLPTPRPGLEAMLARKPNAVETLQDIIRKRDEASRIVRAWAGEASLVAGDFNLPVESRIYQRDWAAFQNAFAERGLGYGWTMFSRRGSVRIDHILAAGPWRVQSVIVGPDLGSAHRPVIADLAR